MTICWCTASWIIKATCAKNLRPFTHHTHTHTHRGREGRAGRGAACRQGWAELGMHVEQGSEEASRQARAWQGRDKQVGRQRKEGRQEGRQNNKQRERESNGDRQVEQDRAK